MRLGAAAALLVLALVSGGRCSHHSRQASCSAQLGALHSVSAWCALRFRRGVDDPLEAVRRCADARDASAGLVRLPDSPRSPGAPLRPGELLVGVSRVFRTSQREERSSWRQCGVASRLARLSFGTACLGRWEQRPSRCRQSFVWLAADLGDAHKTGACVWDALRDLDVHRLLLDDDSSSSSSSSDSSGDSSSDSSSSSSSSDSSGDSSSDSDSSGSSDSGSLSMEDDSEFVYTCSADPHGEYKSDSQHEFVLMTSPKGKLFIKKKCSSQREDIRDLVGMDMMFVKQVKLGAVSWFNCSLWNTISDQMVYRDAFGYINDYSTKAEESQASVECDLTSAEEQTEGQTSGGDRLSLVSAALQVLDPARPDLARTAPDQVMASLETVLACAARLPAARVLAALLALEGYAWQVPLPPGRRVLRLVDSRAALFVAQGARAVLFNTDNQMQVLPAQETNCSSEAMADDEAVEAAVVLPPGAAAGGRRVATALFQEAAIHDVFLQPGLQLNTHVLSVQAVLNGSGEVDIVLRPSNVLVRRRRCGYWNLETGTWDFDNCRLISRGKVSDVCRCRHLTHFAQLVTDADVQWLGHARALSALSVAGVALSLAGALGFAATALLAAEWRRRAGSRALLQLVLATALRDACFAAAAAGLGSGDAPGAEPYARSEPGALCVAVGVALHYCLLAAAAWTTAAAALQLLRFATIAGAQAYPHTVLACALAAWLLPLAPVVGALASLGPGGYQLRDDSAAGALCFPQGATFYTAVLLPCTVCCLASATAFFWLLFAVLFPIGRTKSVAAASRHGPSMLRRRLLTAVLLFFLLGVPWALGPPARVPALAYLFCVTATPHGLVLFLFFVLGEPQLRAKWRSAVQSWLPAEVCQRDKLAARISQGRSSSTTTTTTTTTAAPTTKEHAPVSASASISSEPANGAPPASRY